VLPRWVLGDYTGDQAAKPSSRVVANRIACFRFSAAESAQIEFAAGRSGKQILLPTVGPFTVVVIHICLLSSSLTQIAWKARRSFFRSATPNFGQAGGSVEVLFGKPGEERSESQLHDRRVVRIGRLRRLRRLR
jgi:hypothetical protein